VTDIKGNFSSVSWDEIMALDRLKELTFEPVPFDHPIWILYSSGTTGKPKAITHSHGGVLLEHYKYLAFHNDVKAGEHFFWFTTTGWMMWNYLQATMLVGAVPVLYEGSPTFPDLLVLWRLAEKLPIHHFGTSAPYLTALMNQKVAVKGQYRMEALRSISSTGAPLPPEVFTYIYDQVSSDIWLCSMSGGTDVCTGFVGGVPGKPVRRGHIQGRALGCALYAYDEEGHRIQNELGEMVIEKPMPSMPIYFWADPGDERYHSSYFEEYPGKWRHGDYIEIYDDGSLTIQGRSDSTLNRKGVRIGTAEIYNTLITIEEIEDALVLNLESPNGEDKMPLFIVLGESIVFDQVLQKRINSTLRTRCSPRHVPDMIIPVPDIPYTLSGKKMEVPVKKLFLGITKGKEMNRDSVRNPEAIHYFQRNMEAIKKQLFE
jgi:acetoacetyl-CoA synthetase